MKFKLFTFYILVLLGNSTLAQLPEVEVDLTKEKIGTLPFDTPFNITGNLGKDKVVIFILECLPLEKNDSKYFNTKNIKLETTFVAEINKEDNSFKFSYVRPLRPYSNYIFNFKRGVKIELSQEFQTKIKDYVAKQFTNPREFDETKLEETNTEIGKLFKEYIGDKYADNDTYYIVNNRLEKNHTQPRIFEGEFASFSDKIFEISNGESIDQDNINITKKELSKTFQADELKKTLTVLLEDKKVNGVSTLSGFLTEMTETLNNEPKFESFSNYLLSDSENLNSLINLGNILRPNTYPDTLQKGIKYLSSITNLNRWEQLTKDLISLEEKRDNLAEISKTETLDFLSDYLLSFIQIRLIRDTNLTEFTSESPHLSYESGIGLRLSQLNSPSTNFVRFGSVNITLSPINNSVPLRYFTPWAIFKKTFSFQVGLAKSFDNEAEERIQSYFENNRNLLVGAGFQFKFFRINYSSILYNITDINPTINNPRLKAIPYISASLSIGIKNISDVTSKILTN